MTQVSQERHTGTSTALVGSLGALRQDVRDNGVCMPMTKRMFGLQPRNDFHVFHVFALAHEIKPVRDRVAVLLLD